MQLKNFLLFSIFGFSLYYVLFAVLVFCFFALNFLASFRAFRGIESENIFNFSSFSPQTEISSSLSDEEKIRISLSFIPILGTFLSAKYPSKEILTGRKVGNFFLFLLIFFNFLNGSINILSFLVIISLIAIIVSTSVFLMYQGKFLSFPFYKFIPTYAEIEAFIFTIFVMIKEFFQVAFGKEKQKNFKEIYEKILTRHTEVVPPTEKFWTHPAIIGIPILNFITIPSFFQKKFHEYQGNISEGFLLSILALFVFFFTKNIFIWYVFIFPITSLMAF